MIPNGTEVRVWVGLPHETTNLRGKLNGNYEGEGPVSLFRRDGTVTFVPAERVAWVEEMAKR